MEGRNKLFLLDAMALIYRAFYALNKNPRINSKGLNTSGILGFANTLFDVIKNEKPSHIGVAFDPPTPTLRHESYELYKANRQAAPEDLILSLPYIKELLSAFRIPVLMVDGYEADDVIGTLAKKAQIEGFDVFMMSSDKDLGQLVTDKVKMYRPGIFGKGPEIWGEKEVCEKFGIDNCCQIIDLLSLWGDSSDNIPGVPGIGEVTAKKLLKEFGSVENVLNNIENIENKSWREKLRANIDLARMSKELATIITDVPIDFIPSELLLEQPDTAKLKTLLDELEFRTFAKRIFTELSLNNGNNSNENVSTDPDFGLFGKAELVQTTLEAELFDNKNNIKSVSHDYKKIDTDEQVKVLVDIISQYNEFCFDTETTSLDSLNAELVSISFAVKEHEAFVVLFDENQVETSKRLELLKPLFENDSILKIGQNIKYDLSVLSNYGIKIKGKMFDTMLAHYLIEPELNHGMDYLAETYLGYEPVHIESLIGKRGSNQLSMRVVPTEDLIEYSGEDADITLQLKYLFEKQINENGLSKLFYDIEVPLIRVLESMEREGINLDVNVLREYSAVLQNDIKAIEEEIYKKAETVFNIASPKQLGVVLFEKLKITDKPKKTKTGQYATGEEELVKLQKKHPIIEDILEYRSLAKLKSTYVDALPLLVSAIDRRIHTSFNQTVTSTGRLSSNNPNLQNIPIRDERGREIRKAFVPRNNDFILLAADYSQIELRLMADLSRDKNMIEAFEHQFDIHAATASRVYNIDKSEVTREMRRNAKSVNFGIIYGVSPFGLSENLNIGRKEAAEIIDSYFASYPDIKSYMNRQIEFAREHGYVETIFGRRRYLREINSHNANIRSFAERNAINAPLQGSSADMIKVAMVNIFNEFEKLNLKSKMILQVHDELVFDVYKPELEQVKEIVNDKMTNAVQLAVPVVVDINTGRNWLEAH